MGDDRCFVCEKQALGHAAEGGVLYEGDLVYAGVTPGAAIQEALTRTSADGPPSPHPVAR